MIHDHDKPEAIELLRRWHSGDRAALEALVKSNLGWLRRRVRARLGPRLRAYDETHDQVQEAVVDVLTYGPRFQITDHEQFRALLARIVENNLRDRNRWLGRARRDIARNQPLPSDTVLSLDPPVRPVTRPSQAGEREDREQQEARVRLAIELLDPKDRDVLWMRGWDELTFEEIGDQLGISANAARMRHRKALPRLARKVRDLMNGQLGESVSSTGSDS